MRTTKRARGTAATRKSGAPITFTPVSAPNGRRVHATALDRPTHTACGKKFAGRGWRIALRELDCHKCNLNLRAPRRGTS